MINALDERRKDVSFGIGGTGSEKDIVGVPVNRKDRRPDGLLDVLRYPPVVLLVEGTNSDGSKSYQLRSQLSSKGNRADLAPLPTANLSSLGDHLTQVAALLILNRTKAGFHPFSVGVQT